MTDRHVCFSHGQESGPWGSKIRALAETARDRGWEVESLDYQGMQDPRARADKLLAWCEQCPAAPLLVGSSMGGFVALAAAARCPAVGLFLMAPALYLPGYEEHLPDSPPDCPTRVVHGWGDDVVPLSGSLRFAEATRASLLLVDADHRLTAALPLIRKFFAGMLDELAAAG